MIRNAVASIAVKDMARATVWYEKLFGRAADATPMDGLAEWAFSDGGRLQVYLLAERAGCCSCTLVVAGLEEECSRLRALGIDPGERIQSSVTEVVMIKDPDGNSIALAVAA